MNPDFLFGKDKSDPAASPSLNGAIHFELSKTSKVFLAVVYFEGLILACLGIVSLFLDPDKVTTYYIILLLLAICFLSYSAHHAVTNENQYELVAFILTSVVLYIRVIINYVYENEQEDDVDDIFLVALVIATLFQVAYFILAWKVYKKFGYRLYKTIGTDVEIIRMYNSYLRFMSCLRIDLQLALILIVMAGLFLLEEDDWELYLDITAMILTVLWAYVGYKSIRKENKSFMVLFYLFSIAEPIYIIYKFVDFFDSWDEEIGLETVAILAGIALVCRIGVMYFGYVCVQNFGHGLRPALAREDQLTMGHQSDNAIGFPPTYGTTE